MIRSLKAQENLDLMVAHYTPFDLARPIGDPGSSCNALFVSALNGWEELFGKRLYIFEYYWKLNWYGLPWPIAHSISADIPYLYSRGVKGILSQANVTADAWTNGLNFYIASKLLWNPTLDTEIIKRRWIKGLFAEASNPMEQYYKVMEDSMCKQVCISGNARINALKVFTPQVLQGMRTAYEQALSLATDPSIRLRLKKIGLSLEYTEKMMEIISTAQTDPHNAANLLRLLIQEHEMYPDKFKGVVPDEIFGESYLKSYLKFIESQ